MGDDGGAGGVSCGEGGREEREKGCQEEHLGVVGGGAL